MLINQYSHDGIVTPAKIINYFESKEEQNEVASLFNAGIKGDMSDAEKRKALTETIIRIKKYSLEEKSKAAIEKNDIVELQQIIGEQARLQKLHISY